MHPVGSPFFAPSLAAAAVLLLLAQGTLMLADEFLFHRRRGLPRWERLGHPVDTLTVLVPLLLALCAPFAAPWKAVFLGLAAFSCLCVTKDEWVHARECAPAEQWLHALLFLLHPLLFAAVWVLWKEGRTGWISLQAALTSVFLVWQLAYWNGPWGPAGARQGRGRKDA